MQLCPPPPPLLPTAPSPSDASLMPRNRKTWSSWNLIGRSDAADTSAVCVTYYVNRLQVSMHMYGVGL